LLYDLPNMRHEQPARVCDGAAIGAGGRWPPFRQGTRTRPDDEQRSAKPS